MRKIIAGLILTFSVLFTNCSSCQFGCYTGKKVKLKKGKKSSAGALVGVKGSSDEKSEKAKERERRKGFDERRKVMKREKDSIEDVEKKSADFEDELLEGIEDNIEDDIENSED